MANVKKKSKTVYRQIEHFKPMLERLRIDKRDFELTETTFTKKIRYENDNIIFNDEGEQDGPLLQLINRVRNDAAQFRLEQFPAKQPTVWFDLADRPPEAVVAKVDVRSAYWETAIKLGVISDETNEYLKRNFEEGKELKMARLKALGSLATRKSITQYIGGIPLTTNVNIQPTKEIYMYVCSVLDELMRDATFNIKGAFYYYWDCVFVAENTHKDVIDFVLKHNYGIKTEFTEIDTFNYGGKDYIVSGTDSKMYLIPESKSFLLHL